MSSLFINIFLGAFVLSIVLTLVIRWLATKFGIVDHPQIGTRHIHQKPIPMLGGLAVFGAFFIILLIVYFSHIWPVPRANFLLVLPVNFNFITIKKIISILIAGLLLMLGGFLDDKYHLKPKQQIIWPILACLVVIAGGIGISYMNNPFGSGYWHFDQWKIKIFNLAGVPYYFTPWADLFTFVWLMILMYSTKLLDGLDGLVSGISVIGSLAIFALCLWTAFYQPDVAILALILTGASLGFLLFNFYPAKIFLGEGGSLFIGFMFGILAIISGSKVATSFLILSLPILDCVWVFMRRWLGEHHSPFLADRKHLHFRLLDLGFTHAQAVVFLWLVALIFGSIILFLRTQGKLIILGVAIILMLCLGFFVNFKEKKKLV